MNGRAVIALVLCLPTFAQAASYTLTTVAGSGLPGFGGDGGNPVDALLNRPCAVAVDGAGTLYIADSLNHVVRRVHNGVIDTVAGNGTQGFSGDQGTPTVAQLNAPCGLAVDASGSHLYISDTGNHRVRVVSGGRIMPVAGTGVAGIAGDGGPAISAQLAFPLGLALDSTGALYIADSANHRVRRISGGNLATVAGSTMGFGGDSLSATAAQLLLPSAVAAATNGDLYILDSGNARLRRVRNGLIATIAGGGMDGVFRDARGLALDSVGDALVADSGNQRVRSVTADGSVTTIAGNGTSGSCGEALPALAAQLGAPYGLAVAGTSVYVADYRNNRVVLLSPYALRPPPAAPAFQAVANAAGYQWPAVAPGEVVAVFGSGMGASTLSLVQLASPQFIDTQAGGTRVYFDGVAAPMVYSLAGQVSAIVPYEVAGNPCTVVQVEYNGVRSAQMAIPVTDHVPAIFTVNQAGTGQGAIFNQDNSLNSADNPAARGSTIVFFGTGEGQTNPLGVDGKLASDVLPKPAVAPQAFLGTPLYGSGTVVEVTPAYAGAAPGFTAGLMQINVKIPANAPTGAAVPLYLYFGNTRSKTEVTVAIQ